MARVAVRQLLRPTAVPHYNLEMSMVSRRLGKGFPCTPTQATSKRHHRPPMDLHMLPHLAGTPTDPRSRGGTIFEREVVETYLSPQEVMVFMDMGGPRMTGLRRYGMASTLTSLLEQRKDSMVRVSGDGARNVP